MRFSGNNELTPIILRFSGNNELTPIILSGFTRVEQAAQQLAARLEDKTALIVIDDVWRQSDLNPFLQGGKGFARLFTTRRLDLALDLKAKPVEVDEMTADESIDLLRKQLGAEFRRRPTRTASATWRGGWASGRSCSSWPGAR